VATLLKLTWIELKLFVREPVALGVALLYPILVQVIMAGVFGAEADAAGPFKGGTGIDYYTAGSIGIVIGALGLMVLPIRLAGYRERGVLRRLRASSVPIWSLFLALGVVTLIVALAGTALMLVLGFLAYKANPPEAAGIVVVGFFLGLASHLALGVLLGSVLPTARAAQGVGLALFFAMMFMSGAGPPRDVMPDAMAAATDFLPLTHVVNALQDPWLAYSGQVEAWNAVALAVSGGVLVVASALAWRVARAA
jgi:ABC-2 type transport system permease protein